MRKDLAYHHSESSITTYTLWRHRSNTEPVPAEILERMRAREDLRSRDPTSPALQQMNAEITRTTNEHRRNTWRQFVETVDHKTDPSKLWRTIKAIDGKSSPKAEDKAITFDDTQVCSAKQIANYFNGQFTTSNLGRHTSSRETRLVSREIKRKSLMSAVTFTTDQVIKGISNCSNNKAFGPDKRSIFHLKNLTVDLTAVFDTVNHNVLLSKITRSTLPGTTCRTTSEADNQLQAAEASTRRQG